ncbi:DPYS [Cordylochernes scorpioides]|uniref:dihydropyrimidinase n=1 Tax=Cordylochernes scorpioides TaxID=51811 RepID=A0ABY6LIE2_9ARAC|nr:DPYS [Cordylochernes scorpioides]
MSDVYRQVGRDLIIPGGTKAIDAKGKLVIPGGIDPHTHLELSFMNNKSVDDFYSGTRAALAGGTTMIMDVVLDPGSSLLEAYERWRNMADDKVCCDYGLHVCVPSWNDKMAAHMETLVREKGVNSFLGYLAYKDALMLTDSELIQMLETCKSLGALAQVHAENGEIIHWHERRLLKQGITGPEGILTSRPEEVEAEAVFRASVLANQVNCPLYFVNLTGKSAVSTLAARKQQGSLVYGEVSAAALAVSGQVYLEDDSAINHVCSPPLRPDPSTPAVLMNYLASGSALQVTASVNLTFSKEQKSMGRDDFTRIPPGLNGVEDRMAIAWELGVVSGKLNPCQFVAITSTNAAKIFNLYPRKGRIQAGSDADVVLWDPKVTRTISAATHHQAVDHSVFEGLRCHGAPAVVISQGRVVLEDDQLHVCQGVGRYVPMAPFASYVYCCSLERDKKVPMRAVRKVPLANGTQSPAPTNGLQSPAPTNGTQLPPATTANGTGDNSPEFHSRPPPSSGQRHLQDSTFSLSGAQLDDSASPRPNVRVHNPPGGRTSAPLW